MLLLSGAIFTNESLQMPTSSFFQSYQRQHKMLSQNEATPNNRFQPTSALTRRRG